MRARTSSVSIVTCFVIAALGVVDTVSAQRQRPNQRAEQARPGRAQLEANGPPIERLEITVEDLGTGRFLTPIAPREVYEIEEGRRLRFRMTAIPAGRGAPTRFPATRFMPNDTHRIRVEGINEENGTLILTTVASNDRDGAVPIDYEVISPLKFNGNERLLSAKFYLKIVDSRPVIDQPIERPPIDRPRPQRGSVTLFVDDDYRGRSQTFYEDMPGLRGTVVENDSISSLRVVPGCRVTLYEHDDYRGRSSVLEGDVYTLRGTEVGNDSVSSIQLDCGGGEAARGVWLYEHADFRGQSQLFRAGDSLRDFRAPNQIGNDRASSVRVSGGCEAYLFSDADFSGRSMFVNTDVPDLGRTQVGNDTVSSIRVSCR